MYTRDLLSPVIASLLLCVAAGCSDSVSSGDGAAQASTASSPRDREAIQKLVDRIHSLQPWRADSTYRPLHWARAVDIARQMQDTDQAIVAAALRDFAHDARGQHTSGHGYDAASKALILLRVAFELPEETSDLPFVSFGGWIGRPDESAIGVNWAWPLSWRSGRPTLIARYRGMLGRPYDPQEEYAWFLRRDFPLRDLDSVMIAGADSHQSLHAD